jgi:hypothetical protein
MSRDPNRASEAMAGHILRGTESAVAALFPTASRSRAVGVGLTAPAQDIKRSPRESKGMSGKDGL